MMQHAGGMVPPQMGQQPPPPMASQPPHPQPQQWGMMPPQPQYYQAAPPPPMWNQQPSQIPPPQPVPPPQQLQPMPQPMVPQQQQAPYQAAPALQPPASADEVRTLWIGDLQYWMDENYLNTCFGQTGGVISMKVIRNKHTMQSEGYGFIEFSSRALAEQVLLQYNGTMMPNIDQTFRLNWATFGAGGKRGDDGADYTIFVGDLASDVTDYMLQETFRGRFSSVKGAKVVADRATGRSKGYGFVRFGDPNEQQRAMTEMNGVFCSTRPMRIGPAASKKNDAQQQYGPKASSQITQGGETETDPNNTTIFVGGLDPNVNEEVLRQLFAQYGELVHVKIPVGKRCGFVQFANRTNAEEALLMLNGTQLGGQNIRLSWGRTPANKQAQQDPNQWSGNYYGYAQGYDAYAYAQPAQDPNMYAYATYQGYGNLQQQQ